METYGTEIDIKSLDSLLSKINRVGFCNNEQDGSYKGNLLGVIAEMDKFTDVMKHTKYYNQSYLGFNVISHQLCHVKEEELGEVSQLRFTYNNGKYIATGLIDYNPIHYSFHTFEHNGKRYATIEHYMGFAYILELGE